MNREKKLKIAASIAAIMQFEAENGCQAGAPAQAALVQPAFPVWGMAGRSDLMLNRSLWQRRIGRQG